METGRAEGGIGGGAVCRRAYLITAMFTGAVALARYILLSSAIVSTVGRLLVRL